jgi:hypothetical protein
MIQVKKQPTKIKIEYGDFQTPVELAEQICRKLIRHHISPDVIIEPTCGIGNFIQASAHSFKSARSIIGIEINQNYIKEFEQNYQVSQDKRILIKQADFFYFDWKSLEIGLDESILVIGNFPWITNSQQGVIGGKNLPEKNNSFNYSGIDAITGKSNFDISEWMLIRMIQWLHNRNACLAMLCKTSISRKLLNYIAAQKLNLSYCSTDKIDAKKHFGVAVDACLLFCQFDPTSRNYFCDVFSSLESKNHHRIGYQDSFLVNDSVTFHKLKDLYNLKPEQKWRSGIKHDCSSVMELQKIDNTLVNGLGEVVKLEETFLFPLLKGSDVAHNRIEMTNRYVIVPQRFVGEPTEFIKDVAPKTWHYLEEHAEYLNARKSKIYQNNPRFSIFGVGSYTFLPWKIAICGLYKQLTFRLIGNIDQKPTIFDDTVYFLSFADKQAADQAFHLLTSSMAIEFYSSLIFWDEKRPIKTSILNSLNLDALAEKLSTAS